MPPEPREEDDEAVEDDEELPIREVAALKADEDVGAENPPLAPPL